MFRYIFLISNLALITSGAYAGVEQCERNFSKDGGFFKGTTYKTSAIFKNVKPSTAYKRVYLYTAKDGWTITESDKDLGIISASQDVSFSKGKQVPLNIIIEDNGATGSKVSLTYSTSGGVSSPTEAVKKHFCSTLAEVTK
jgi:hypothetical protein